MGSGDGAKLDVDMRVELLRQLERTTAEHHDVSVAVLAAIRELLMEAEAEQRVTRDVGP